MTLQRVKSEMIRIIFVLLSMMSRNVFADDLVLTVVGRVTPMPCTVDTTQLRLDLGKIYASELAKPGSYGSWVNGTIRLSNCPAVTTGVTASFSGQSGSNFYRNIGTAKNIEIQLQTISGDDLNNGKSQPISITPQRTAELPIRVRAYSGAGKVTDGTIQATINITYTYQ
ncbi:fimbrial protein [Enterobacter asburiae]|uniref:fimbrial protein n=1 Tax=Enterobacter asburiae TaxID=61645 RepID=UPI003D69318A